MIDTIIFLREDWLWPVLSCALLLWVLFIWKEYALSGTKRIILKAIVAFVVVASLVIMVLRPLFPENRAKGVGVILTENYNNSQLDSLKKVYKKISVIPYDGNGFKEAQLDSINSLYVLGTGIAPYDFWQVENIATSYLGENEVSGIVRLHYNEYPAIGDSLKVSGLIKLPTIGNRFILEDAGGNGLDSIAVSEDENLIFNLQTMPRIAGNFVYTLVEKDSLDTVISKGPIPITVRSKNKLSILIINTFPTFETKYLKNFLAEDGHEILVRSQLTKGKYKFENFNRKQGAIYGFTAANLADFDLLIIDTDSYTGLSGTSTSILDKQVNDIGLGIFIQPDAVMLSTRSGFDFRFKRNKNTSISLSSWPKVMIPTYAAYFESDALVQPILSSQNNVLSAYRQQGNGRVSTSILNDTYRLILEGNHDVYQYIWSTTMSAVSQKILPIAEWKTEGFMAYINEPYHFTMRTSLPNPQVNDERSSQLSLQQDIMLSDQWEGTVYPREKGWNHIELMQDSTIVMSYYVGNSSDWSTVKAYNVQRENARTFTGQSSTEAVVSTLTPISRCWFFIVFIVFTGILWVLPRLER